MFERCFISPGSDDNVVIMSKEICREIEFFLPLAAWHVWKYSLLQRSSRIRNISEMIEPILGLFPLEDKL